MKGKLTKTNASNSDQGGDLAPLITELRGLIHSARHAVATTVNTLQVLTNFEIGRRIVQQEQKGAARAEYGKELLKELSARLTEEFGRGFSKRNLDYMRRFYLDYAERPSPSVGPIMSSSSPSKTMKNAVSTKLNPTRQAGLCLS